MTPARFDVAVVGGGPAGCAAAIGLAREGADVVLLERSGYDGTRIGETLPPEARLLLERLGVWDRFREGGHMPSPGIVSAWGRSEPYVNDSILNPYGCGWRVDRNRFDAMLAAEARDAGAVVLTRAPVERCTPAAGGGWELAVRCGDGVSRLAAAFVVDATGRSSSFRGAFGTRRVVHDRMVAVVGVLPPPAVDGAGLDMRALIEATEEGWWYSARLPDRRLILAFHTDAGPGLRARWSEYLGGAPETAARSGRATDADVRVVSANSHRTEPVAGTTWLGVGDAATAHDPLSGLGIHWALESGILGAEAILAAQGGDPSATTAYGRDRQHHFELYLVTRTQYYRAENRWPQAPFWRRRQAATA